MSTSTRPNPAEGGPQNVGPSTEARQKVGSQKLEALAAAACMTIRVQEQEEGQDEQIMSRLKEMLKGMSIHMEYCTGDYILGASGGRGLHVAQTSTKQLIYHKAKTLRLKTLSKNMCYAELLEALHVAVKIINMIGWRGDSVDGFYPPIIDLIAWLPG